MAVKVAQLRGRALDWFPQYLYSWVSRTEKALTGLNKALNKNMYVKLVTYYEKPYLFLIMFNFFQWFPPKIYKRTLFPQT